MLLNRLGLVLTLFGTLFLALAVRGSMQGSHEKGERKDYAIAIIKSPIRLELGIAIVFVGFLCQFIATLF